MNTESKYVYELGVVSDAIAALRDQLPGGSALLYSMKANPHPRVVEHAARQQTGLEVSSEGELAIAVATRRRLDHEVEIVCTGPGKTTAYLEAAASARAIISIETATEIQRMRELGIRSQDILVRINASSASQRAGLQMTGTPSQFGIDEEDAEAVVREVIAAGHNFRGVHLYMGSNIVSEDDLVGQFEISTRIAEKFVHFASGEFLADLGGGFGHPFAVAGERPRWARLQDRLEAMTETLCARSAQVTFESGRYIAGGCGHLNAVVLDVKRSKGQKFVVLSSGVNHLGGLSGLRRLPQAHVGIVTDAAASLSEVLEPERIVGPLCTPVDILNKQSSTELSMGDTVTIPNVGAYGLSASLANFLGHPYPAEEVRLGGRLISTTYSQVVQKEVVPA
ncbi:hypothetical protein ACFWFQ_22650 [Nocardia salmonicida]|uniref:hypothetical protein n=1 Tax=Nocardia salmonicida TaxID=53431 RepID=UPI003655CA8C